MGGNLGFEIDAADHFIDLQYLSAIGIWFYFSMEQNLAFENLPYVASSFINSCRDLMPVHETNYLPLDYYVITLNQMNKEMEHHASYFLN